MKSGKLNLALTNYKIKLGFFNKIKLLILFSQNFFFYKKISTLIFFEKLNNFLILKSLNSNLDTLKFYLNYLKKDSFLIKKFLVFKGIGIRGSINKQRRQFSLKLGLSHLIVISFPRIINIYKKKTIFLLNSIDKVILGCFLKKIKFLKLPDSYKGRGIWYKGEKKILKAVKKKK